MQPGRHIEGTRHSTITPTTDDIKESRAAAPTASTVTVSGCQAVKRALLTLATNRFNRRALDMLLALCVRLPRRRGRPPTTGCPAELPLPPRRPTATDQKAAPPSAGWVRHRAAL